MLDLLNAQFLGLLLFILVIGVVSGYIIGREAAWKDYMKDRYPRAVGRSPSTTTETKTTTTTRPQAPQEPDWEDGFSERPDDIERVYAHAPMAAYAANGHAYRP